MMEKSMTPDERDQLIQRYFDGETLGPESELAERLLDTDPEAQKVLATLRTLSDSIKIDVAGALSEEDFSEYWANIAGRLPEGPLSLAEREDELVVAPSAPLPARPSFLERIFGGPGLVAAVGAVALVVIAVVLIDPAPSGNTGTTSDPGADPAPAPMAAVDNSIIIEDIESPSDLVMVQQESDSEPAIIWIVESESSQEG